ncbi:glycosyltransferase [Butyrivibrio sp. WCD3002]|jgi:dolichol-phosphate mannosyltransferase|uniref:glycosyltransferase n=1 Tax=Butyrivibrio sp. WCD3002 TaxID=1280676 RepID=UPI00047C7C28|nr:glycosyltransferase [Butyrivibrio sp. WCD3002]
MANSPKTIIVMPVANEADTMAQVIDQIMALPYDNLYYYPVIDDFSKDDTEKIIREKAENNDKIKLIYYKESRGVISCYLEGYRQALEDGADRIIEMDGGLSHDPKQLPMFIEKLDEGYDCVWGSRFMKGGGVSDLPLYRRILSGGGTFLSNLVLGTKLKDMTSGYEAFQRKVLENIKLDQIMSTGHMYQTEMRFYCRNLNTVEVPIHYVGSSTGLKASTVMEALSILFKLKDHEKYVWKNII